jgi:hypothetical protein
MYSEFLYQSIPHHCQRRERSYNKCILLNWCVMNVLTKGAAKRLILSLLLATGLGGCAVYEPYGYAPYPYGYDYGYAAPAYGYAAPAYGYAAPAYGYAPPVYVGPPISLDLGFGLYHHGGGGHHGFRGHHGGHGGFHGGHGGFHGGHGGRR